MSPILQQMVLHGASRHCLYKGFLLVKSDGQPVDVGLQDKVVDSVKRKFAQHARLADVQIKAQASHVSLLHLVTPFSPIYTVKQRDAFIQKLAHAAQCLLESAVSLRCKLIAAGVNACFADGGDGQPAALCNDIHQIEAFDEADIEAIYNVYRQFLPELVAISANSSVYGKTPQKDSSVRMRFNQSSFLPRYLTEFSVRHLEQLQRTMRQEYGVVDLRQMDVNPLGGDIKLLAQDNPPLLKKDAGAVELRFVDAQCSFAFIRAQMLLFQAIAMYGRTLAHEGRHLRPIRDEVIDENKALALQNGAAAVLKPDEHWKDTQSGGSSPYHSHGVPERATTALLMTIEELLLPALRDLGCEEWELAPIVMGAELRRGGKKCLTNYAEYQQYLWYTQKNQFSSVLHQQVEQLLARPTLDLVTDYNRQTYRELSQQISKSWAEKLAPRPTHGERVR